MPQVDAAGPGSANVPKVYKRALSINEFGEIFGPGRTLIYELINSGQLRAVKLGTKTLIPRDDADAWLASLPALKPRARAA